MCVQLASGGGRAGQRGAVPRVRGAGADAAPAGARRAAALLPPPLYWRLPVSVSRVLPTRDLRLLYTLLYRSFSYYPLSQAARVSD